VNDGEIVLLEEVESHQFVFIELTLEPTDHIFILELSIGSVVVDDGEEGELT
jgi:hypothetical protein